MLFYFYASIALVALASATPLPVVLYPKNESVIYQPVGTHLNVQIEVSPHSGTVTYLLDDHSSQNGGVVVVVVDRTNGTVRSSNPLDSTTNGTVRISVVISASSGSALLVFFVRVLPTDLPPPHFLVDGNRTRRIDDVVLMSRSTSSGSIVANFSVDPGHDSANIRLVLDSSELPFRLAGNRSLVVSDACLLHPNRVYEFSIVAVDWGQSPRKNASLSLRIIVPPDNTTQTIHNDGANITVSIRSLIGATLLRLNASDTHCIGGSIIAGNADNAFEFNSAERAVVLANVLRRQGDYHITINVTRPGRRATVARFVFHSQRDETDPRFERSPYIVSVPENKIGVKVGPFIATSTSCNGRVNVELQSGNTFTCLDCRQPTPHLSARKPLLYSERKTYNVNLTAYCSTIISWVYVIVDVVPTPTFERNVYNVTKSLLDVDDIVTTLRVQIHRSAVRYKIESSPDADSFRIDAENGTIRATRLLTRLQYNFTVTAIEELPLTSLSSILVTRPGSATILVALPLVRSPVFHLDDVVEVQENSSPVRIPVNVTYDSDGVDRVVVSIRNDSDGVFDFDSTSRVLTVNVSSLDFELQSWKNRSVVLVARGRVRRWLVANHTLTLVLRDVNDNSPVFDVASPLNVTIAENIAINETALVVAATDADSGDNGRIAFRLDNDDDDESSLYFEISSQTGIVRVIRRFPPRFVRAEYALRVTASDRGQPARNATIAVFVRLAEVNEYAPQFHLFSPVFIDENLPVGSCVVPLNVTDRDRDGVVVQIVNETGDWLRVSNDSQCLVTNRTLDYETQAINERSAAFALIANDTGNPSLASSDFVVVVLRDVNDNAPVFDVASPLNVTIAENVAINETALVVVATDADSGDNGRITFCLDDDDDESSSYFNISPQTGIVRVIRRLPPRFVRAEYALRVTATDHGRPARNASMTAFVRLVEVNEYAPKFHLSSHVFLDENAPVGSCVVPLNVTDRDRDGVVVRIVNETSNWLRVSHDSRCLVINRTLDYETERSATFVLTANDTGNPSLSSSDFVVVVLRDVNDNAPVFDVASPLNVTIAENVAINETALVVVATDADSGDNGRITFCLDDDDESSSYFNISPQTGIVRVIRRLPPRFVRAEYALRVTATDHGRPARNASMTAFVRLVEVNEYAPKFHLSSHVFLDENAPVGSCVVPLNVTDCDRDGVVVRIVNETSNWLRVSHDSRCLVINRTLDYETERSATFVLTANDTGNPSLSSTDYVVVVVVLRDVNDNAPVFDVASPLNVTIAENIAINETALVVVATDVDSGDNGRITFRLDNDDDDESSSYFNISSQTGIVRVIRRFPPRFVRAEYAFRVTASDHGQPARNASIAVFVRLVEVNEYAPKLHLSSPLFLDENSPVGRCVVPLNVTDRDRDSVVVRIVSKTLDWLRVSNDSRCLVTNRILDYEAQTIDERNATFILTANDTGSPSLASTDFVVVDVVLRDVNDNAPAFVAPIVDDANPDIDLTWNSTNSTYGVTTGKRIALNRPLFAVRATDRDSGSNGEIVYYPDVNSTSNLNVTSTGNVVVTSLEPNRTWYRSTVLAVDGGVEKRLTGTAYVTVFVADAPEFSFRDDRLEVDEGVNETIPFRVENADRVSIVNQSGSWSLVVHAAVGDYSLALTKPFDYEVGQRRAEVRLVATYKNVSLLRTEVRLTIDVKDVNEYSPVFVGSDQRNIDISSLSRFGTTVYQASATDDDGSGNEVAYSFGSVSRLFAVDRLTGNVTVATRLLIPGTYRLDLIATDSGVPTRNSSISLFVTVISTLTESPRFSSSQYSGFAVSGKPAGSTLLSVTASGSDEEIVYTICCSPDFAINSTSGEIRTNAILNATLKDDYALNVNASYVSGRQRSPSSTVPVLIYVAKSEKQLSKPYHCTVPFISRLPNCLSSPKLMLDVEPALVKVNDRTISIRWEGWTTLNESTMLSYEYSITAVTLGPNGLLRSDNKTLLRSTMSSPPMIEHEHELSTRAFPAGRYIVLLKVQSVSVTGDWTSEPTFARRLILVGVGTETILTPNGTIEIEPAPVNGIWLTNGTGLSLRWDGVFANTLFVEKPWILNDVVADPNVEPAYDNRKTIQNSLMGIQSFRVVVYNIGKNFIHLPVGLNETKATLSHRFANGDELIIEITATDVFDSSPKQKRLTSVFDLTPPELLAVDVSVSRHLLDDETQRFVDAIVAVSIRDDESGLDRFNWTLEEYGTGSQTALRRTYKACNSSLVSCSCNKQDSCFRMLYYFQLNLTSSATANLRSDQNVTARVIAYNQAELKLNASVDVNLTFDLALISIEATATEATEVRVVWGSVASGTTANIYACPMQRRECTNALAPAENGNGTVTGLKPNTHYFVQVEIVDSNGQFVALSNVTNVVTLEDAPSEPPTILTIQPEDGGDSLFVTWEKPPRSTWNSDRINFWIYEWQLTKSDGSPPGNQWNERKNTTCNCNETVHTETISGLNPNTGYWIRMKVENAIGTSPPSAIREGFTRGTAPKGSPLDFRVTGRTCSGFTVKWDPVNSLLRHGSINKYEIFVKQRMIDVHLTPITYNYSIGINRVATVGGWNDSDSFCLGPKNKNNLRSATDYEMRIRAFNSNGPGPYSGVVVNRTLESVPGRSEAPRAISLSTSAIRLEWHQPDETNGEIIGYFIRYRRRSNSGGNWTEKPSPNYVYQVESLQSATTYEFQVIARTAKGKALDWSPSAEEATREDVSGAPGNVTAYFHQSPSASCKGDYDMLLTWDPPESSPTSDYEYIVEWGPANQTVEIRTNETMRKMPNFFPFTEYDITVSTTLRPHLSSSISTFTPAAEPGMIRWNSPTTMVSETANAVVILSWNEPEPLNGLTSRYEISLTYAGQMKLVNVSMHDRVYRVAAQLFGETRYNFRIRAYNYNYNESCDSLDGPWSDVLQVDTDKTKPAAPTNVEVYPIATDRLFVSWSAPDIVPKEIRYRIRVRQVDVGDGNCTSTDTKPTSSWPLTGAELQKSPYVVSALKAGACYEVGVVTIEGSLSSEEKKEARRTLISGSAVTRFEVKPESRRLNITWELQTGLNLSPMVTQVINTSRAKRATETVPVSNLRPATVYRIALCPKEKDPGFSCPLQYSQTLEEAPSGKPQNFTHEVRNDGVVDLSWLPPKESEQNGVMSGYNASLVRLTTCPNPNDGSANMMDWNETNAASSRASIMWTSFKNLRTWTCYFVQVFGQTRAGDGPPAKAYFRTKPDQSELHLIVTSSNSTALRVQWVVTVNEPLSFVNLTWRGESTKTETRAIPTFDPKLILSWENITNETTLMGLAKGTWYTFTLEANGTEPLISSKKTEDDLPGDAPRDVRCASDPNGNVYVSWKEPHMPNGKLTTYSLCRRWRGITSIRFTEWNCTTQQDATEKKERIFKELNKTFFDVYEFSVIAHTIKGGGPRSRPCTAHFVVAGFPGIQNGEWQGVVAAVFVIFAVILVFVLVRIYCRKMRGTLNLERRRMRAVTQMNPLYPQLEALVNEYPDYEFPRAKVALGNRLGEGNFGEVYLATANSILEPNLETKVAVKLLKHANAPGALESFIREMETMMKYQHMNIVSLLGVCTRDEPLYMITEYMEGGDLKEYLIASRSISGKMGQEGGIQFKAKCRILFQVACALDYLSSSRLVHRDIAARNCLVGPDRIIKLADFGLARGLYGQEYYRMRSGVLPLRWMAPEAVFDGKHSVESDVWAFGVLIWEVFTMGQLPYYGWSNEEVLEKLKEGWHLALPDDCPEMVCELMEWCWETVPADRVKANLLVRMLDRLTRRGSIFANAPLTALDDNLLQLLKDRPRQRHTNVYTEEVELVSKQFASEERSSLVKMSKESDDTDSDVVVDIHDGGSEMIGRRVNGYRGGNKGEFIELEDRTTEKDLASHLNGTTLSSSQIDRYETEETHI